MRKRQFEKKLENYGFHSKESKYNTLIIYRIVPTVFQQVSKELDCAEISTNVTGQYYVMNSKYIALPVINIINIFASTPLPQRVDKEIPAQFVLLKKYGIHYICWYIKDNSIQRSNPNPMQLYLFSPVYFLTRKNLIKLEDDLLSKGVYNLIVKRVNKKN